MFFFWGFVVRLGFVVPHGGYLTVPGICSGGCSTGVFNELKGFLMPRSFILYFWLRRPQGKTSQAAKNALIVEISCPQALTKPYADSVLQAYLKQRQTLSWQNSLAPLKMR